MNQPNLPPPPPGMQWAQQNGQWQMVPLGAPAPQAPAAPAPAAPAYPPAPAAPAAPAYPPAPGYHQQAGVVAPPQGLPQPHGMPNPMAYQGQVPAQAAAPAAPAYNYQNLPQQGAFHIPDAGAAAQAAAEAAARSGGGPGVNFVKFPPPAGAASWDVAPINSESSRVLRIVPDRAGGMPFRTYAKWFWKSHANPSGKGGISAGGDSDLLQQAMDGAMMSANPEHTKIAEMYGKPRVKAYWQVLEVDNLGVHQHTPEGVRPSIIEMGATTHKGMTNLCNEKTYSKIIHPEFGRAVKVTRKKTGQKTTDVEWSVVDLEEQTGPLSALLNIPPDNQALVPWDWDKVIKKMTTDEQVQAATDLGIAQYLSSQAPATPANYPAMPGAAQVPPQAPTAPAYPAAPQAPAVPPMPQTPAAPPWGAQGSPQMGAGAPVPPVPPQAPAAPAGAPAYTPIPASAVPPTPVAMPAMTVPPAPPAMPGGTPQLPPAPAAPPPAAPPPPPAAPAAPQGVGNSAASALEQQLAGSLGAVGAVPPAPVGPPR